MAEVSQTIPVYENQEALDLSYSVLVGDAKDRLRDMPDSSVHLIVTSPPYGSIKKYSDSPLEIGFNQSYREYHDRLLEVFQECYRVLHPGCRMIINIGDEFVQKTKTVPFHIRPHASELVSNLLRIYPTTLRYYGDILWQKVTTSVTSGGGKIMGSVYHPRDGYFFVNYEHLLVFKKMGKAPKPKKEMKDRSRFSLEQRRKWFRDIWKISPEKGSDHAAPFPIDIPERLIRMYSFVGETVLDPFVGSGTTIAAAAKHNRSAIGIDLGFKAEKSWQEIVMDKVNPFLNSHSLHFH